MLSFKQKKLHEVNHDVSLYLKSSIESTATPIKTFARPAFSSNSTLLCPFFNLYAIDNHSHLRYSPIHAR